MGIRIIRSAVIALVAVGLLCPCACYGDGLRTGFGKIILENIPMGRTYSMRKDSKFPLRIKNESDRAVNLKIEVLIPGEGEVQQGYEPIPEAGWITLEKNQFVIGPNDTAETDVLIDVPYDSKYLGRKFHVFIMSYTTGESLGIGLKSKLLFSVGEDRDK